MGSSYVCAGSRVDAISIDAAMAELATPHPSGRAVHLCTTHTLSIAARDPAFREVLNRGDLNLADGMPLVWIARCLGIPLAGQVGGRNLMAALLGEGRSNGLRHYLYGSTPYVLDDLQRAIGTRWPGATIVGAESPPFRPLSDVERDEVAQRIGRSGADVVWVGLGTPRQDYFVDEMRDRVDAAFVAVGAAFDFHAGTKSIAPSWMTRSGLEWLFRLTQEPRRLWRRYLVGNSVFVYQVIRHRPRRVAGPADGPRSPRALLHEFPSPSEVRPT